jgi:hypothetical protein
MTLSQETYPEQVYFGPSRKRGSTLCADILHARQRWFLSDVYEQRRELVFTWTLL